VSLLGVGGMGEVYRAHDTKLHRDVAIKVLPSSVALDRQRLSRFEQEARVLAALNHPHVGAIYGFEETADGCALILELVDGPTLAQRLEAQALGLNEAIRIANQIVEAVKAAHQKGIIHRDLKPANIKITHDGVVKVLDFGLAKAFVGNAETTDLSQMPTGTEAGVILGTPAYMSPEQARGQQVNKQTDIWAFGCVLYEMLARRHAFMAATTSDTIAAILTRDPDWDALPKGTPAGIQHLLRRCLEKDSNRRLHDIADAQVELHDAQPDAGRKVFTSQPLSKGRVPWFAWLVGAIVVAVVVAWGFARFRSPGTALEYIRLTNFPDSVHSPALSKDGKMLAFVRGPVSFLGGPGELYLKVLPDGQPVALTQDGNVKIAPVFSPDSSHVVYTNAYQNWSSITVPISGGSPALMMPNAAALRWVAAGQVLFSELMSGGHMGLVTASENRSGSRPVYFPESDLGMVHFSELSPDGRWVLAVEMLSAVWQPCRVVPFDGSSSGKQVGPLGSLCTAAAWSPDGQWMYFAAETNGESHLWRQRFPDGPPEQLTSGLNQEWGVAVDPNGQSLITAVGNSTSTVWYHDEKGDRQLSLEGYAYRPLVSPDGKKVFYLVRKGVRGAVWSGEMWAVDLASGRNDRLLSEFLVQYYDVSEDGQTIVFESFDESGRSAIWIAPVDRSRAPRRLTRDGEGEDRHPFLGVSGNVYFIRLSGGRRFLYRMKTDGSNAQQLLTTAGYFVNISPDEKWAAFWNDDTGVLLHPVDGGPARSLCSCSAGPIFQDSPRVSWSGDGKLLVVNAGGSMSSLGTTVVPWNGPDALPRGSIMSGPELRKLPGALQLHDTSVALDSSGETYAFARTAGQSNLYRIRLR
jgi:eukaryotic-like serine/threonine-protein kinase